MLVAQSWAEQQRASEGWATAQPNDAHILDAAVEAGSFVRKEWRIRHGGDEAWPSDALLEHLGFSKLIEIVNDDITTKQWLCLLQYRDTYTHAMYGFALSSADIFYMYSRPFKHRVYPERLFSEERLPHRVSPTVCDQDDNIQMSTDGFLDYLFQNAMAVLEGFTQDEHDDRILDIYRVHMCKDDNGAGCLEITHSGRLQFRFITKQYRILL